MSRNALNREDPRLSEAELSDVLRKTVKHGNGRGVLVCRAAVLRSIWDDGFCHYTFSEERL